MKDKKIIGKKSRAAGQRFEKKVRDDLEDHGFIVNRWSNNVEFQECDSTAGKIGITDIGKLVPAKPKFVFNPTIKKRVPIGMSSGFPDFVVSKKAGLRDDDKYTYDLIGIECKINGYLNPTERNKCKWLLDNNIFSKILIAKKGIKRGEIEFIDFSEKHK